MKWIFTIIALLLFIFNFSLFLLNIKNIGKHQVEQVLYGHESTEENCFETIIEAKEAHKTIPYPLSVLANRVFIPNSLTFSRHAALYLSGFIASIFQPPRLASIFLIRI